MYMRNKARFLRGEMFTAMEQCVLVAIGCCLQIEATRIIVHLSRNVWFLFHVLLKLHWLRLFSLDLPYFIYISLFHQQ